MDSIGASQIKKFRLREAAEAESTFTRNLVPPEPWQEIVSSRPGLFASLVSSRLLAGARNGRATIVNARKAHQAIRPVPILGIAERIAYEALTEWVLPIDAEVMPTQDTNPYRRFIFGPIKHALAKVNQTPGLKLSDLRADYVVQADIAAFYQYVDHSVLLDELQMQTGNIDGSRMIVDLLAEVQGARFGLPQLLHASDRLAEMYMAIIHRNLIRRGFSVWRYNDDFRFAVEGYANAQQVVEDLSEVAQSIGLISNDSKTYIQRFGTYLQKFFSVADLEDDERTTLENMVIDSGDYEEVEEAVKLADALSFVQRLGQEAENRIDLRSVDVDDVRRLRRSVGVLARNRDESALPFLTDTFALVPQLTPRFCEYLIALADGGFDIYPFWQDLISRAAGYNSWQRAWLVYVARSTELTSGAAARIWIESQISRSSGTLLHAEAALALAQVNAIDFGLLDEYLRTQPESLIPWYVLGIGSLGDLPSDKLEAVKQSSPLNRLLIG